ncbi:hypothetical protein EG834_21505, partial [bacterium]|nr:hypothetical protein [bacterium]
MPLIRPSTRGFVMAEADLQTVSGPVAGAPEDRDLASPTHRALRRFVRNRIAFASAWFLAALSFFVLLWPAGVRSLAPPGFAARLNPDRVSEQQFQPPNAQHWFGT